MKEQPIRNKDKNIAVQKLPISAWSTDHVLDEKQTERIEYEKVDEHLGHIGLNIMRVAVVAAPDPWRKFCVPYWTLVIVKGKDRFHLVTDGKEFYVYLLGKKRRSES